MKYKIVLDSAMFEIVIVALGALVSRTTSLAAQCGNPIVASSLTRRTVEAEKTAGEILKQITLAKSEEQEQEQMSMGYETLYNHLVKEFRAALELNKFNLDGYQAVERVIQSLANNIFTKDSDKQSFYKEIGFEP